VLPPEDSTINPNVAPTYPPVALARPMVYESDWAEVTAVFESAFVLPMFFHIPFAYGVNEVSVA